jgi:4-diphosphocytidyl-2-C-methyl-D-erythritol kinase
MEFFLPSPAKVNVGLWLLGRRPDGYHEIFTPIVKISLFDLIRLKPSDTLKVETSNRIPQEENFVFKGLKLFEEITGVKPKFEIFIEKQIPVGGGLGGGSSNLATVLNFVNEYYGRPLTREKLSELLARISSDASAFLCDGIALAKGRGEKVECINPPNWKGKRITLFVPKNVSSPTKEIYSKTEPSMFVSNEQIRNLERLIKEKTLEEFFKIAENRLGEIFLNLHPEVKKDIDFLQRVCYKKFIVSGSGSSFYTVGSLDGECLKALDRLKKCYKIYFLVVI